MKTQAKQKFFIVIEGREPGIYFSWPEAQNQVWAYPGALYRKYKNKDAAERAFFLSDVDIPDIDYRNKPEQRTAIGFTESVERDFMKWKSTFQNPGDSSAKRTQQNANKLDY